MKYGPGVLLLGWERWLQRLESKPEIAMRELRQSKHLISPDLGRFAPVRLLFELGRGDDPASGSNADNHADIAIAVGDQGWRLTSEADARFQKLFDAYSAYCCSLGTDNAPRGFDHSTNPMVGRTFLTPVLETMKA